MLGIAVAETLPALALAAREVVGDASRHLDTFRLEELNGLLHGLVIDKHIVAEGLQIHLVQFQILGVVGP